MQNGKCGVVVYEKKRTMMRKRQINVVVYKVSQQGMAGKLRWQMRQVCITENLCRPTHLSRFSSFPARQCTHSPTHILPSSPTQTILRRYEDREVRQHCVELVAVGFRATRLVLLVQQQNFFVYRVFHHHDFYPRIW